MSDEFTDELVASCAAAVGRTWENGSAFETAIAVLRASKHAELVAALKSFVDWAEAYPTDIFPEPNLRRAHELLKHGGMTLDVISAYIMRETIGRIGECARAALKAAGETHNESR